MLIFPLITMRSFSEELNLGTAAETLMTAPVRDWQVVLAKWLGCLFFTRSSGYRPRSISGSSVGPRIIPAAHSPGSYVGSYLLLLLMGMFYCAVGCFGSVLTKNQIVAAVISLVMILALLFMSMLQYVVHDVTGSRCADVVRLFLPHGADADLLLGRHRFPPHRLVPDHDGPDADLDLSRLPDAEMEVVIPDGYRHNSEGKKVARIHRFAIGANVAVQIVALLFILSAINYIAFKHFKRWDYSVDQSYALFRDVTKQLVGNLHEAAENLCLPHRQSCG